MIFLSNYRYRLPLRFGASFLSSEELEDSSADEEFSAPLTAFATFDFAPLFAGGAVFIIMLACVGIYFFRKKLLSKSVCDA